VSEPLTYTASRGEIIEGALWKAFSYACREQSEVLLKFNSVTIKLSPQSRVNDLLKEYWQSARRTGGGKWQENRAEVGERQSPPIIPIIFKRERVEVEDQTKPNPNWIPVKKKKKRAKKKKPVPTGRVFDFDV
jgi:hypothetical protein